jgi:threonine synthase
MQFKCIKSNKTFPFWLNFYNNPLENSEFYSNIFLDGWYKIDWYKSLVPFKKLHFSYWAKNTPLVKIEKISNLLWLKNLQIKDESSNPYWTHKDRRSEYIVNVALENNVDKIVCLTAWNAGYSLARYCCRAWIDYTSLIFPWVSDDRKKSLEEWGNAISIDWDRFNGILRPRDFKQIVEEYDKYERKKIWKNIWAVTNSFEPISINAYKELFYEIKDENPDYVVAPCWSWDIIVWIWLAIKELWMNTKIIWVAPKWEHPLKNALELSIDEYTITNYKEKSIAEKLTTPFSWVLPILYKIFKEKGNIYTEVWNEEIEKVKNKLDQYSFKCENSAVVSFATFLSYEKPEIDPNSKIIIISTWKWLEN